jgi:hypothetical protein
MSTKGLPELKIEHGVPIPPVATRQGANIRLLQSMKPGDSVFFDKPIEYKAVRLYRVAKKTGIKIVIRKEAHGMRVWRVSGDQPTVTHQTRPVVPPRKSGPIPKSPSKPQSRGSGRSGRAIARSLAGA